MPFTKCLGCDVQKRNKSESFISTKSIQNPLITINNIRQKYNLRRRSLNKIDEIPPASKVCRSCYQQAIRNAATKINHDLPDLSIYREGRVSHTQCTFGCKKVGELISIPKRIRRSLLMEYKFLAISDARMCIEHLEVENYWPYVKQICKEVPNNKQKIISDLMYSYYNETSKINKCVFDIYRFDSIDDTDLKAWFGYDKEQFKIICMYIEHCKPLHIAVLLCKLRTSLSNEQMSLLFGCCERTIANHIRLARDDLIRNFVPIFLNNNSRETLIQHKTFMSQTLFDIPVNKGCVIFDGTYRLCQKSKNFAGQKNLWSEQKKLPLIKPMVGCTPDGYVLFVLGPYDAKHNDATILQECFERYEDTLAIIEEGDFMFLDRGFRDVLTYLTEIKKIRAYIPGLGCLETLEANITRFITKIRWIIEQLFGRLKKKFRLLAIPAYNSTLSYDFEFVLIGFALLNLFHMPIISDDGDENIAHLMLSRLNVINKLKNIVNDYNLSKVTVPYIEFEYRSMDNLENNRILQFPEISLDDLYHISLGVYQINNAISYYAQHQKNDIFLVHKFEPPRHHATAAITYHNYGIVVQDPLLVKAYMRSRYRNSKNHHIFVLVDRSKNGRECIMEYFCTCESGSRTVGCCSHIMTIIWYLGYGQYHPIHVPNPEICNSSITISNQSDVCLMDLDG